MPNASVRIAHSQIGSRADTAARPGTTAIVTLLLLLVVYIILFWRLGVPSFWDPDEAHYAETSREMIAAGDWLAPRYNGEPFFDKPVLFHQLQGAAMAIFGPTEFAARIVPAVAALGLVAVTIWFGCALGSARLGLMSGALLALSPGMFALARYAILDTLFTAFVFAGAALVAVAALRNRPRLQWPGYVCVGLAVLTKGPVALALCGLTLLLAAAVSAELRRRFLRLRWAAGLMVIIAIAAPWFAYMYMRFGQRFVEGYLLDENIRLFVGRRFGGQPGPWFYFQIVATGLLPWTGMLVGRLADDIFAVIRHEAIDPEEIVLWAWVVAVLGFFTASSFRLDHYVFPAAPALSMLCARSWMDLRTGTTGHRATRLGALLVGPMLVTVGVGLGYFVVAHLELPRAALLVPAFIALCGVAVTAILSTRLRVDGSPRDPLWFGAAALVAGYVGVIGFVMPALEKHKVVPDLARFVAVHAPGETRVASYRMNRWSPAFRFYVNRQVDFLELPAEAERYFADPRPFYCLMPLEAAREFAARGTLLTIVYEREGTWATSGRQLLRRRLPTAHFVVVSRPAAAVARDSHVPMR